jgi:hypothetical protein
MKKTLAVLMVVSGLMFMFVIGANAGTRRAAWIDVPFAFQAGDALLPAGEYLFEFPGGGNSASGSLLRIGTKDGSICKHMLSRVIEGSTDDNNWQVSFAKYGDTYFVAKVRSGDIGGEVSKSRTERNLAKEFSRALKPVASVELKAVPYRAK